MSEKSLSCPTCGVHRFKPRWPSINTTPWTDECSCSDKELCMYHRFNFNEAPKRPPEEVMEARAAARHDREVKAWEEEQALFAAVARRETEFSDMRNVLKVILEADALKSHAYERGDDDASIYELIKAHLKGHE